MFSTRKNPPHAANFQVPEGAATLAGSPHDSPSGQAISHPRPSLNTPSRPPARWREAHATWHGWTWSCTGTMSARRHDRLPWPTFFTNRGREPFFVTHPYRCRHPSSADSNHCGGDTEFPQKLSAPCAQLTMVLLPSHRTPARI